MDVRDYAASYEHQYAGTEWFEQVLVASRRRQVLESLRRYPHRRILEVGCGLEPLFRHADEFETFTIVEPCVPFIERARVDAAADPRVTVLHGFLEEISFPKNTFDFIVVSSLLHEVDSPAKLLDAVRHQCGPTTTVHFNVPNVHSMHRLLALEMGLISDLFERSEMENRFGRSTRFDKQKFIDQLTSSGFTIINFGTYFLKPFTHSQMEKLFDLGILDKKALNGFESMIRYFPDHGAEMFADVRLTTYP